VIQVHVFRVPLGTKSHDEALHGLVAAREAITSRHPSLLGMMLTAQDSSYIMDLRVTGHDRWRVQHNARLIAAVLARRAGLPYKEVEWVQIYTQPNARHMTKEEGRQFSHAPRGPGDASGYTESAR